MERNNHKAWIVAVDMGYGHQRAAYPIKNWSPTGKMIIANNYPGISKADFRIWNSSRRFYEAVSKFNNLPFVGPFFFSLFDKLQRIAPFYPYRDLSKPTWQTQVFYRLIKKGWGKHLVDYLNTQNIPLITTFFLPAFFAEEHKFKQDIYCVICDADIARTWAPLVPSKSRIKYLTPCHRATARMKLYGVKEENIILTGFPLPKENLGVNLRNVKKDLANRIINLDPKNFYRNRYQQTIKFFLKRNIKINSRSNHPLTLTFAVGGAGAQAQIAKYLIKSLSSKLLTQKLHLNLVAGTRNDVYCYFYKIICDNHLKKLLNKNIKIIYALDKESYFKFFSHILSSTDILWTKPSELSFYTALGLPIIMAPPIGSQEIFNKDWLTKVDGGMSQEDPRYTHQWLFDWVNSGWLAEAAMSGFLDGRQFGVKNIEASVFHKVTNPAEKYQLL